MSCSYSLSFCVPPPLQKEYVKQQQSSSPKLYSFSGGMLDQSAWTTMGWIGWAMAWGTGLPDGVCGRVGFCGAVLWASAVSGQLALERSEVSSFGFAPACGSLRDGVKSRPLSVRIANVHELRIEKETGCYLDYLGLAANKLLKNPKNPVHKHTYSPPNPNAADTCAYW